MNPKIDATAPSTLSAPSEGSAPGKRARPGDVEYEVFRCSSKGSYPYPWAKLDPRAPRTIETSVYINEWERAVLHFVAGISRKSISKLLLDYGLRAALLAVIEREG